MAAAGHVDAIRLTEIIRAIEAGTLLTTSDADLLGRFNGAIDAAMDAGFERGDQQYRNACRLVAGLFAVGLSVWAGALVSVDFWTSVLAGLIAVPLAPIVKDLASSLQAAATAVQSVKP
jgi:hypothetical protein